MVVNCVGLGARELVDDASMEPIRGQIVRVRNPGLERFVLDEENPEGVTYIVPRSDDCILGGTAEEGEWDLEPDPETAAGILRRCTASGAAPEGRRGAGAQGRTKAGPARDTPGTRGRPESPASTTTATGDQASPSPGAAPKRRSGSCEKRLSQRFQHLSYRISKLWPTG